MLSRSQMPRIQHLNPQINFANAREGKTDSAPSGSDAEGTTHHHPPSVSTKGSDLSVSKLLNAEVSLQTWNEANRGCEQLTQTRKLNRWTNLLLNKWLQAKEEGETPLRIKEMGISHPPNTMCRPLFAPPLGENTVQIRIWTVTE